MDSLYSKTLSIHLEEQLTSIYVSTGTECIVNVINVDQQNDSSSCSPYAIAFAYHTAIRDDVSQICFDYQSLRIAHRDVSNSEKLPMPFTNTKVFHLHNFALTSRYSQGGK